MILRGKKFYLRKRVPKNVQSKLGKKEIWKSLRTDSLQTAKRRLPVISAQIESEIENARKHAGLSVDETLLRPLEGDTRRSNPRADENMLTFEAAYNRYLSDPTHDWSTRTRSSYTTSRNLSLAAIGEGIPMSEVSRAHCREYMELLRFLPRNATKRFPLLTPQQAAERAKADKLIETISAANANVYLADFSTFLNWAVNEELIPNNPVRRLRLPDKIAKRDKRLPFSQEQLTKIFNAPLYTGCQDGERGYSKVGNQRPRNARFWVPLIALHTGMRLNEICQLDVTDIQSIEGIACIVVSETSQLGTIDKKLKTGASDRIIPLHSNLLMLGLPDFSAQRLGEGHTKLFYEINAGANGIRSIAFSKWFTQFLRKCGANSPKTCFHSFRHSFRDELRAAEISFDIAHAIGGWSASSSNNAIADSYGSGYSIAAINIAIQRIAYRNLDFSHLLIG